MAITLKKIWHFIWYDDSIWSWIVNIVLAFLLIYFIVYPVLGAIFQTSHPIVAVVSGSMEHRYLGRGSSHCGTTMERFVSLDEYWNDCGQWYDNNDITKDQFRTFPFKNGFNKGDIMILAGKSPEKIAVGDVIVYNGRLKDPIIHRIVKTTQLGDTFTYKTKGDHNPSMDSIDIKQDITIGYPKYNKVSRATLRVPYLGWVKIWFVEHPILFIIVFILIITITSNMNEVKKLIGVKK